MRDLSFWSAGMGVTFNEEEGNQMKITRIDNETGTKTKEELVIARDRLERTGYHKEGTIDECIKAGEDFVLRTPWAHWRFEL